MTGFSYEAAFSRNFGLLSPRELEKVRRARIGIAGLGGCGSNHLLTLVRMGFETFSIADPDVFEIANLNRQAGARMSSLGRSKVDVMREMVRDINPHVEITTFPEGLVPSTLEAFIETTDIGINAIDFFRIDLYGNYHDGYTAAGKYSVVGASPFSFGAAMTVLGPGAPSFAEVFGLLPEDGLDTCLRKFCARMTPSRYTQRYLTAGVNEICTPVAETTIASNASALALCTALTSAEVLFIVTGKRAPTLAPRFLEFDMLERAFCVS